MRRPDWLTGPNGPDWLTWYMCLVVWVNGIELVLDLAGAPIADRWTFATAAGCAVWAGIIVLRDRWRD